MPGRQGSSSRRRNRARVRDSQDTPDAVNASKMIVAGLVAGCVVAGCIVLFMLFSAPNSTPGDKSDNSAPETRLVTPQRAEEAAGSGKPKVGDGVGETKAARPTNTVSRRSRKAVVTTDNSKYKNAFVVSGGGKPPKMMQPQ